MADTVTVKILGLKELDDRLTKAGPKFAKKVLRKAMKSGAEIIKQSATSLCPVLTESVPDRQPGELKNSIDYSVRMKKEQAFARIGPTWGDSKNKSNQDPAFYGIFEEFGSVHNSPHAFMRGAFDTDINRALEAIISEIEDGVEGI